jgi:hypothetical protein
MSTFLKTLDVELQDHITKTFEETNLDYSFETIPNTNYFESEQLQNKIHTLHKISLEFTQDADIEMMMKAWDDRYQSFFDKLTILLFNPEHIINRIRVHNKWLVLFPTVEDLKDFKMLDELLDEIFKEFTVPNIKKTSNKPPKTERGRSFFSLSMLQ